MVVSSLKRLATTGIILRRIDYGEADRIITFLTEDYGKLRAIAKGVRKQKSKLAGGIELFSVSELHLIKGKGDIDTLVSTRLIKHYGGIVRDLYRTQLAYDMLKSANKTIEDHAGAEYYLILQESLAALDSQAISPVVAEQSFSMRMLQRLGHVPDFSVDTAGNSLAAHGHFQYDSEAVAFVPAADGPYDQNHLKVMKLLAHNGPAAVARIRGISAYCETLAPLISSLRLQYIPG
ncbi:MAG: DNA repair protein RecO [Candidatus Saccharimonadales bacterium]